jgi:RHH-type rel operon transcriptional repressor/antitoxin RelB
MLAIRLPPEIEARLDELARRTGRSKDLFVEEAVIEHLADLEDLYLAETRLEDLHAGKTLTFTLEAVERELGLED